MIPGFLLIPVLLRLGETSELSLFTDKYIRCHDDKVYVGTLLDTVVVRASSHCAALCSRNDCCQVIHICSRDSSLGHLFCSLLGDGSLQFRISPQNNTQQNCLEMAKIQPDIARQDTTTQTVVTTEPLRCENNGTLENGRCHCPIQYAGIMCQRLIRDCREPYDNGYTKDYPGLALLIQPVGAPTPFWAVCILSSPAMTYPLVRSKMPLVSFNVSWTAAKTWIGLKSSSIDCNSDYFIGLDNLHHLLSQAKYVSSLYCRYNYSQSEGWVYYADFAIGPENSSYALSYQSNFTFGSFTLDNGFTGGNSLPFHTKDHDTNNCKKAYPGWFGPDCTASSLFADTVVWPINGSMKTINYLNIGVARTSQFAVN